VESLKNLKMNSDGNNRRVFLLRNVWPYLHACNKVENMLNLLKEKVKPQDFICIGELEQVDTEGKKKRMDMLSQLTDPGVIDAFLKKSGKIMPSDHIQAMANRARELHSSQKLPEFVIDIPPLLEKNGFEAVSKQELAKIGCEPAYRFIFRKKS